MMGGRPVVFLHHVIPGTTFRLAAAGRIAPAVLRVAARCRVARATGGIGPIAAGAGHRGAVDRSAALSHDRVVPGPKRGSAQGGHGSRATDGCECVSRRFRRGDGSVVAVRQQPRTGPGLELLRLAGAGQRFRRCAARCDVAAGVRLPADSASFHPHVTLAYARGGTVPVRETAPIVLQVSGFHLIHSIAGQREYEVLGQWTLQQGAS